MAIKDSKVGYKLPENKALISVAKFISFIFHPVFMPVAIAYTLYFINPTSFGNISLPKMNEWMGSLALNSIFFPIVTVFLLKKLNFIDSIYLNTSKDRIVPLIATMIYYFWAYMVIKNYKPPVVAPQILKIFLLGNFWGIIAVFMVNIFKKVSMHTAAAGSMIGILIVAMITSRVSLLIALMIAILIAGIIGTARLVLKAHSQGEIGLGYILGIISQLAAYLYLTKLVNMFG